MYYVELLRARRVLIWYGAIVLALTAIGLALVFKDGPPHLQMSRDANPMIPLAALLVGSLFAAVVLAAFLAVGLDAEFKTTAITWTRPLARLPIALRNVAVDLGTLLVAWVFTFALIMAVIYLLGIGQYLRGDGLGDAVLYVVLGLGCAVMWYGLVALVTMLLPGRGNAIAGASWAYALFVPGLAAIPFPHVLHEAAIALNYVNPLAYLSTHGHSEATVEISSSGGLIAGTMAQHAIATWVIGLIAIALATRIWATREVPA